MLAERGALGAAVLLVVTAAVLLVVVLASGGGTQDSGAEVEPAPPSTPPPSRSDVWPAVVWSSVRLPPWFSPINYTMNVNVGANENGGLPDTFSVEEKIFVRTGASLVPSSRYGATLAFHVGPNLQVSNLLVDGVAPLETYYNSTNEMYFLRVKAVGATVLLQLTVSGPLASKMVGFYRSSFQNNGKTREMASTDFEPTGARRAFACFDEPAMKAVFELSLIHPASFVALGNMARITSTNQGASKLTTFLPSVKMSTYLVAWAVAQEFESASAVARLQNGNALVPVRVWARTSALDHAQYAANVGARVVEYYSQWFGIDFPLSKVDMIAIPNFASGAMEVGLIRLSCDVVSVVLPL
jgi:aminopeptidase N